MDIARPEFARQRRRRRLIYMAAGLVGLTAITIGLARLQPAAPRVDSPIWSDTVKRGDLILRVRGNGTLVPEEIRWVAAQSQGRVERILVWPGTAVSADTVVVELTNPEVEQAAFDAEWQLKGAESELANLRVQLESQRLNQTAVAATAEANYNNATMEAEVNAELAKDGLVPALTLKQSQAKAREFAKLNEIEQERLKIIADAIRAQQAVQEAKVAQYKAQLSLKRRQVEALKIRPGIDGVLQKLGDLNTTLQVGQQLAPGANVARVANPARLKAEIRVAETQAKDIQLGQKATIDTRNGETTGRVVRIDPAVLNGTVTVDVALEGPLPKGARPDLSVDGVIELDRLTNVLHVGLPVGGHADSTVGLFRLDESGRNAVRVPVKLGRSSVNSIEVIEGLAEGEKIIVSDMSAYDAHDRVRVN